jgi:NADPH-dependent curcumin reductase CurA
MTPTTSRHWVLSKKPTDLPVLSGADATFSLTTTPLPSVEEGQVLIKIQYLSNDPAQRLWISGDIEPERLYTTPVEVGDTMTSYACISEVIESRSEKLPVGSVVLADAGWREYAVLPEEECMLVEPIEGLNATHYVSLFGVVGVTAMYGLVDIAQAGPNDTVVISGAAGAVGSMAVQIAKHVLGCKRVIGIAGTDAKCMWVERLGADVCINYKNSSFKEDVKKATEGYVEVFFDNVGGEILDLMLTRIKKDGRVAACGAISDYNSSEIPGIKNWYQVIAMRIQIRGFVVLDAAPTGRWTEIVKSLIQGYKDGEIKATEEGLAIVPTKFEDIPKTWMELFEGRNSGKLLTKIV